MTGSCVFGTSATADDGACAAVTVLRSFALAGCNRGSRVGTGGVWWWKRRDTVKSVIWSPARNNWWPASGMLSQESTIKERILNVLSLSAFAAWLACYRSILSKRSSRSFSESAHTKLSSSSLPTMPLVLVLMSERCRAWGKCP